MSSRWTPKWAVKKVSVDGKEVEVCYDSETMLYACPLCSPACKNGGAIDSGSYFFTEEDLIEHLRAHKVMAWTRRRYEAVEEEEEPTEEEEEEE